MHSPFQSHGIRVVDWVPSPLNETKNRTLHTHVLQCILFSIPTVSGLWTEFLVLWMKQKNELFMLISNVHSPSHPHGIMVVDWAASPLNETKNRTLYAHLLQCILLSTPHDIWVVDWAPSPLDEAKNRTVHTHVLQCFLPLIPMVSWLWTELLVLWMGQKPELFVLNYYYSTSSQFHCLRSVDWVPIPMDHS